MKRKIAIAVLFTGLFASGFYSNQPSSGLFLAPTVHADGGSTMVMIGGDGIVLGPNQAMCQLFNPDGTAIPGGTVTLDNSVNGFAKFTWQVNGGKLEVNFPFPDTNATHNQAFALVPVPGGPSNQYYLLLSDDHILIEDDPNFVAEGVFSGVKRVTTKCQYVVQIDKKGGLHSVSPVCIKCVYIFNK